MLSFKYTRRRVWSSLQVIITEAANEKVYSCFHPKCKFQMLFSTYKLLKSLEWTSRRHIRLFRTLPFAFLVRNWPLPVSAFLPACFCAVENTCIPMEYVCDSVPDCAYGTDKENCPGKFSSVVSIPLHASIIHFYGVFCGVFINTVSCSVFIRLLKSLYIPTCTLCSWVVINFVNIFTQLANALLTATYAQHTVESGA